ncbi:hypothetical protein AWC15_21470 [Mycobacterium lacus]|uniref:Uncharacterized protein n=1 Tax=Mycobacterium lacus TaxID=169765 RepID=A0A1X1Y6E7_9MYCO|nr:hypothetical protein AWC15_21470 [Mycobacterium lacus]BBX96401.1 hypothetical protein MLAC_16950 [Mycobacterium lacus]
MITAARTEDHRKATAEAVELATQAGGYGTTSNEAKVTRQLTQRLNGVIRDRPVPMRPLQ